MRILFISDLLLEKLTTQKKIDSKQYSHHPTRELIVEYVKTVIDYNYKDFINIINWTSPDLILIGGDLTDEFKFMIPPEDIFQDLINLFEFINDQGIQCYLVEGNHDTYFSEKISTAVNEFPFIEDISQRVVQFNGLTILGLSYKHTYSLRNCRKLLDQFPEKYDIVLAHAQIKRRMFLFDLETRFILTGHAKNQIAVIDGKIYAACEHSPRYYYVIDINDEEEELVFYHDDTWESFDYRVAPVRVQLEKSELLQTKIKLKGNQYKIVKDDTDIIRFSKRYPYEDIYYLKKKFDSLNDTQREKEINKILDVQPLVSSIIREYLKWGFYKCDICGKRFPSNYSLERHKNTHK